MRPGSKKTGGLTGDAALLLTLFAVPLAHAEVLTIAVASNFRVPAEQIAASFEQQTGHQVRISSASTGKLYAQINSGAPFDVLLAADSKRPRLLEEAGVGIRGTRQTYAIGGLVLWSRDPANAGADCRKSLRELGTRRLAIANPKTAPYGIAAREYLTNAGLWTSVSPRLVYGENIAQALHFVATGNASLGLIAASQLRDSRLPEATCTWRVPAELHAPIEQQAIQVDRPVSQQAAAAFLDFLQGVAAREIVTRYGYGVSE